jgi:hypothetical protein
MYRVEVSEYAVLDFEEAYLWYEEKRLGLGDYLSICFEEALESLRRNASYEVRYKGVRILNIKRFPYQIVFRIVDKNTLRVIAFFHAKRNPSVWKGRK